MIAFLPTPNGSFHMGTLFTYFAGWLMAKLAGWDYLLIPDIWDTVPDDIDRWRNDTMKLLGCLGIEPTICFGRSDLIKWQRRYSRNAPPQSGDESLCYHCTCPLHLGLDYYPDDPCRPVGRPGTNGTWRLKSNTMAVYYEMPYGAPRSMLPLIKLQHSLGIGMIARGMDLRQYATSMEQFFIGLGWPVPSSYFVPILVDGKGTKLSTTLGATPVDLLLKDGCESILLLRTLYSVLQGRRGPHTLSDMVDAFRPERVPQQANCRMKSVWTEYEAIQQESCSE